MKHLLLRASIAACLAVLPGIAGADTARISQCMQDAGKKYNIHPYLLWAIAKQESSFNPRAVGKNSDGSEDIGLMQINSTWLGTPEKPGRLFKLGIRRHHLFDPCISIDVGAWVLAHNFKQFGVNWRAVGAYNAKTEWKRERYARKIQANLAEAYALAGKPQAVRKTLLASSAPASPKNQIKVVMQ